jgi:hypothetical protein
MENVSIVALEPWGNQDFDIDDIYYGAKTGVWLYLVYCRRDEIPFDMEELLDECRKLNNIDIETSREVETDEQYRTTFEMMLDAAGIKWDRLPDQCFTIYSTLF